MYSEDEDVKRRKTFLRTVGAVLVVSFLLSAIGIGSAWGANNNNGGNNNNNNARGSSRRRAGEELLRVLVLFTGPQNWDYVGVLGESAVDEEGEESESQEDLF